MHRMDPCWLTSGDVMLPLVPLGLVGVGAACALWRMGREEARNVGYGYTLILYDAVQSAMFFAGAAGLMALGATVAPCWFLAPSNFLGLYLWMLVLGSLVMFAVRIRRHAPRRRAIDRLAHILPSAEADCATEEVADGTPNPSLARLSAAVDRVQAAAAHAIKVDATLSGLVEEVRALRKDVDEIERHIALALRSSSQEGP